MSAFNRPYQVLLTL